MYECAQSAITSNNLNLPLYDLHQRQARDQILFNFHTLAQTTSTISERHLKKCMQQRERIEALRARAQKCKQRMEELSGLNQAIVFVSPAQYPTKYQFDIQKKKSGFSDLLQRTQVTKLDMNAQYVVKHDIKELGKEAKLKIRDLEQFVLFMFGRLKGKRKTVFQKGISNKKQIETLGKIPTTIRYIDSLTVFNTHINPYRKYELANNNVVVDKKDKTAPAPQAVDVMIQHTLVAYQKDQYQQNVNFFKPTQKPFEEFDLDDNLQDLTGVVDFNAAFNDDITNFGGAKKKTKINDTLIEKKSESVTQSTVQNSSNATSTISDQSSKNYSSAIQSQNTRNAQNNLPPPPPPIGLPPNLNLPPPPPPIGLPPPPIGLPPPPPPIGLPPPPPPIGLPPPPPPIGLPPPPLPMGLPPPLLSSPMALPASGDRSALLSEIQQPNPMARLKRTVTKQYTGLPSAGKLEKSETTISSGLNRTESQAPNQPPKPMSMMEALKAKIAQRFIALHPQRQSEDEEDNSY